MQILIEVAGSDAELPAENLRDILAHMALDEKAHRAAPARISGLTLGTEFNCLEVRVVAVDGIPALPALALSLHSGKRRRREPRFRRRPCAGQLRSRYASAVNPRQRLETCRASYWVTFWACEPGFQWAATIPLVISVPLALDRSPAALWFFGAGVIIHAYRLAGRRFFRPRPRRLP